MVHTKKPAIPTTNKVRWPSQPPEPSEQGNDQGAGDEKTGHHPLGCRQISAKCGHEPGNGQGDTVAGKGLGTRSHEHDAGHQPFVVGGLGIEGEEAHLGIFGSRNRPVFLPFGCSLLMFPVAHDPFLKGHFCECLQRDIHFVADCNQVMEKTFAVIDVASISCYFMRLVGRFATLTPRSSRRHATRRKMCVTDILTAIDGRFETIDR